MPPQSFSESDIPVIVLERPSVSGEADGALPVAMGRGWQTWLAATDTQQHEALLLVVSDETGAPTEADAPSPRGPSGREEHLLVLVTRRDLNHQTGGVRHPEREGELRLTTRKDLRGWLDADLLLGVEYA